MEKMDDLISVVIPIYNVETYLMQCIDSVLQQSYQNLEVILVDDGSPDNCGRICDDIKKKDNRIRVVHKKNEGLGLARNTGLEYVTGKYVIFVDSDDWLDLNHIEKIYGELKRTKVDTVIHNHKLCDNSGAVLKTVGLLKTGVFTDVVPDILLPMLAASDTSKRDVFLPVSAWSKLFSVDIIKEHGLKFINEKECLSEDIFFDLHYFAYSKRAVIIDSPGYNYRYNQNSISKSFDEQRLTRMFKFYENLRLEVKKNARVHELIQHRVERCYLIRCRSTIKAIVNSQISYSRKRRMIKEILRHPYTIEALKNFPIHNQNMDVFLVSMLMKLRLSSLVYWVFFLKKVAGR